MKRLIGLLALISLSSHCVSAAIDVGEPPNIIFILADDLGWTDLGCQGSKYYETPNIDRLAEQGTRFLSHRHCQNCAPTRASLMSGQYAPRTGIYTVGSLERGDPANRRLAVPTNVEKLPLDRETIADRLRAAGYVTGLFGKWHLGEDAEHHPLNRGFDEAVVSAGRHFDFRTNPRAEVPEGAYLADWLTDRSLDFIDRHKAKNFYLSLHHFGVHAPLQAKPELVEKYRGKKPRGGHSNPSYAAMIESVDQSVGRVLKKLDDLGLAQKTLVLFASDNGGVGGFGRDARNHTDNAPLRGGKGQHYEGGLRVPLIARLPGVTRPGSTCRTPTTHVDLYPTFLELARASRPSQILDGLSLVPLLKDSEASLARTATFAHLPGYLEGAAGRWRTTPVSSIVEGDWKLLEFLEDGRIELYDLSKDIGETKNLADVEKQVAKRMREHLAAWRNELKAAMPTCPREPNSVPSPQ